MVAPLFDTAEFPPGVTQVCAGGETPFLRRRIAARERYATDEIDGMPGCVWRLPVYREIATRLTLAVTMAFTLGSGVRVAWAAGFDCAAASSVVEKTICGDAALSAADTDLAVAFTAALSATPRPQVLRGEQREWIGQHRNKAATVVAMRDAYSARIAALRAQTASWLAVRASLAAPTHGTCLPLTDPGDATCAVDQAGTLAGGPGGGLRYILQTWKQNGTTTGMGVAVIAGEGADARLITWSAEDSAFYETPRLIATSQGILLDLPGHMDGTGSVSAESLFVWRDASWREIDATAWIAQLQARLANGLAVWKGVYPDWRTMTATTPLWRTHDGNCCPTGGSATVTLRLEGERIVLATLKTSSKPIE